MLDKRCIELLNIINHECNDSGYKIFSIEELVSLMPERFGIDGLGLAECIKTLYEREYISVKYQDDNEVCMCPLTKGRLVFENKLEQALEKSRAERRYFLFSFAGAVAGGVGSFLVALLFRVIVGGF
ncbi:MAG: hypothetical protein IJA88_05260 [Clostridia bacterium]|nr:hypothetical protein [Clostridia bacterium]